MDVPLEPLDRRLLDLAQAGVPLVARPYAALGLRLGCGEAEVLARLRALAAAGILRQIGGIFDTRTCGYRSALVMARVQREGLGRAAARVGEHPGVTHCYERDHPWNLWFTVAVPPDSALGLGGTVDRLGAAAGVEGIRLLPALRVFKIGATFDMDGGAHRERDGGGVPADRPTSGPPLPLEEEEIAAIRALQRPLPLVEEPFRAAADAGGLCHQDLLRHAAGLLARGAMRRFAALLNHRRAGFRANALAVWAVPAGRLAEAGRRVATFGAVTHCYQRPTYPDWPYGLLSMLHGRTREECLAVVGDIRRAIRPDDAATLWSVREFKKVRLQLFTPDSAAWERAA